MKYLLDTNTCIHYLNGRSPAILRKLPTVPAQEIVVCSVVRGELAYGAAKVRHRKRQQLNNNAF